MENKIYSINGPVVTIKGKTDLEMMEMVYVGKDKNGHALWYSAGGSDVKPKNLGPKRKQKYENRNVYVRIRLK